MVSVTIRAIASAPGQKLELERLPPATAPPETSATRLFSGGEWVEISRVWREDLAPGHDLEGPLLVLEYSSTTWIPHGWRLTLDDWGNLHLAQK